MKISREAFQTHNPTCYIPRLSRRFTVGKPPVSLDVLDMPRKIVVRLAEREKPRTSSEFRINFCSGFRSFPSSGPVIALLKCRRRRVSAAHKSFWHVFVEIFPVTNRAKVSSCYARSKRERFRFKVEFVRNATF